jgi:CheY-like chemotaxis protein
MRMNTGRARKENMTAFDPTPEQDQVSADSREIAMLRHDISGALYGVIGGLSQVETGALPEPMREQFDRIAASAKTVARLVGVLLAETADGDAPDVEPATADLRRLLCHIRRRHAGEARERGLAFVVQAADDLPRSLLVDPTSLVRIVDNLIGNALKFAEVGTIRLTVARDADGDVIFRLTDEGPGLGGPDLDRRFRFGARAQASSRLGQGLGLHIVRALADRLGGAVSLSNRPEGGVEAVLRFPASVAADTAGPVAGPGPDLAGLRILLAEDNPTNQMVASQMLRALNADVIVASDGFEALEQFERAPIDLVVVDIEMPRMSGLDVIRAIRTRGDARAQVPIVALTAYAMREHRERIAAAGANGLISKPVTSVEALGHGLAAHVARARSAPAGQAPGEAAAGPVIDQATYAALCDAIGPEMMAELLDKVIADLLGARRDLAAALEPLDRAPIRAATHILISVAGALGAVRLQACARALNATSPTDAPEGLQSGARRCMAEIDAAVAFARERRSAA